MKYSLVECFWLSLYLADYNNILLRCIEQMYDINFFVVCSLVSVCLLTVFIVLYFWGINNAFLRDNGKSILRDASDECIISLTDIKCPERTFRCALGEGIVIGRRSERCMIVLDRDIFVSERHCRIYRENDSLMIENLCKYQKLTVSSYGRTDIKLNQKCVCELSDGDIIILGLTAFKIRCCYES